MDRNKKLLTGGRAVKRPHPLGTTFLNLVLLAFCSNANAALTDRGTYITDTATGLDWLKLTETSNRSYNDISSQLGVGGEFEGWRYATGAEFEAMLFGQGATAMSCYEAGTNFCGWSTLNQGIGEQQLNMLGDPFEQYLYGHDVQGFYGYSIGILADMYSPDQHWAVYILDLEPAADYIYTHQYTPYNFQADPMQASYLVRTAAVPLPAAVYLFSAGLPLVIGAARRKRRLAKSSC